MVDEFDDLDLSLDESPAPPVRGRSSGALVTLLVLVLAGGCGYLAWLYTDTTAANQSLAQQVKSLDQKNRTLSGQAEKVRDQLVELADHAASEAELHYSLGNDKQALADIDHGKLLLNMVQALGGCGCKTGPGADVQARLDKLLATLQPGTAPASEPTPAGTEPAPSAQPEEQNNLPPAEQMAQPQSQPESPVAPGPSTPGGEPDA